jgi:hypothetical protein
LHTTTQGGRVHTRSQSLIQTGFRSLFKAVAIHLRTYRSIFLQLNGGSMSASLKFKDLRNFRSLVSLAIEDRHLGSFHDFPPQLKHLTLRAWKNIKLPFDFSDFISELAAPRRTEWVALESVRFDTDLVRTWDEYGNFRHAAATGTRRVQNDREKCCCLIWHWRGVAFTERPPSRHSLNHWQWSFVHDEACMKSQ